MFVSIETLLTMVLMNVCLILVDQSYITPFRFNVISVCVVNVHFEDNEFDKNDEIQHVNGQQEETASFSDATPSDYLKHQGIVYANTISNEETEL